MLDKETIHIAWPTAGTIDNYFAVSLLDVVRSAGKRIHSYNSIEGTGLLSKSRNLIVKHFLDNTDADWILMIDSDQFIPTAAFKKLVAAADKKNAPVVSALVFGNKGSVHAEPSPCIYTLSPEGAFTPYNDYPQDQLVEIYSAGAGCLLIHRSVLESIREMNKESIGSSWAWFQDGPIGENVWLSEDLMFCEYIRKAGYKIYAHTGAVMPHHKKIWFTDETFRQQP